MSENSKCQFHGERVDLRRKLSFEPLSDASVVRLRHTSAEHRPAASIESYSNAPTRKSTSEIIALCSFPKDSLVRSVESVFDRFYGTDFRKTNFYRTWENYDPACEYDLEEGDLVWLRLLNTGSVAHSQLQPQELAFFVDRLERSWDIVVNSYIISKTKSSTSNQDYPNYFCKICEKQETTPHNILVICENCDISVHQECYGVPLVPEGPWLCRMCFEGLSDARCVLCGETGRAMKQTVNNKWCHLLCARLLGEEIKFLNQAYLEPIDIDKICKERWRLICSFCSFKKGAPVQCSFRSCFKAMHPSCAQKAGCEIIFSGDSARLYCPSHAQIKSTYPENISSKLVKLMKYPFIPALCKKRSLDALLDAFPNFPADVGVIDQICRFWSLKRRHKYGQTLLDTCRSQKKLHRVSSGTLKKYLAYLNHLLVKLRKLENICFLILRRELDKHRNILLNRELLLVAINPTLTIISILVSQSKLDSDPKVPISKARSLLTQMLAERLGVTARSAEGPRDDHREWEAERNMAKPLVTLAERSCTRLGIEGSPRGLVSRNLLCKIWHNLIKKH